MLKSILVTSVLTLALAACAQTPPPAPPTADSLTSAFVPYCGQVWVPRKQGYEVIPCPPESNYPGGTGR